EDLNEVIGQCMRWIKCALDEDRARRLRSFHPRSFKQSTCSVARFLPARPARSQYMTGLYRRLRNHARYSP
ncbi:MAG TPA: hypothetical protein VFI43_05730, partial [Nitrosospira sp.]|nr:hypothetical protein [Nitrosospira sp.]